MILYLDPAAISSAKTSVAAALSLSDAAMGAVFSAFALCYSFAQMASGNVGFRRRAMECVHSVDGSRQRTRHVARCAILVWRRRGRRVPRIGSRSSSRLITDGTGGVGIFSSIENAQLLL